MRTYIGSKIVKAEPMSEHTFLSEIKGQEVSASQANRPGYHLHYPDDYHSWAPTAVFEGAYRELSTAEVNLLPAPAVKDFAEARKTMSVHLNQDEDLQHGYQSNVAMYLHDHCDITDHEERNARAKELLKLIFD